MIQAVIFDCFGVLYVDASHAFYEERVKEYATLRTQLVELNSMSDYGLISRGEWAEQVAELTNLSVSEVENSIQSEHVRNNRMLAFAKTLRARGIKVGMLSNIGEGAMDLFFTPSERAELFDAVVLSCNVGMTKPNPAIFTYTAEQLGCTPGECLMIDDIAENCSGADAAGLEAVQYSTSQVTIHDVESALKKGYA